MLNTNIDLYNGTARFTYILELTESDVKKDYNAFVGDDKNNIYFSEGDEYLQLSPNYISQTSNQLINFVDIIYDCPTFNLKMYLPKYSLNIKYPNIKYILTVSVLLGNRKIILSNNVVSILDSLANDELKRYNQLYNEHVEFSIPDPRFLLNDNNLDAKDFKDLFDIPNLMLSSLYITLTPVIGNQTYDIIKEVPIGQNSIFLYKDTNKYMNCQLTWKDYPIVKNKDSVGFYLDLMYDENYKKLSESNLDDEKIMKKYLTDIYNIRFIDDDGKDVGEVYFLYEIAIKTKTDIYFIASNEYNTSYQAVIPYSQFNGMNWTYLKPGMFISGLLTINIKNYKNEYYKLHIHSNDLILDENILARIISLNDEETPFNIDLDNKNLQNMKIYNINAINKTVKEVKQIVNNDNNRDFYNQKSNIIQPVFYKSYELNNIVLHPEVTENICINLDIYKSQVKRFVIQIEGVIFKEIGRTANGVIFKIIGKQLLNKIQSGTYYILNENLELVTSGKYIYEV